MKTPNFFRIAFLSAALPFTFSIAQLPAQAQPAKAQGQKAPKKGTAVKHAEEVLGKPLTPAQKSAVRAAQKQRAEAIKPIQEKFKASVAKALGLSVADYETREKALRKKKGA